MIACTRCTARFSASPEIELTWSEMHDRRFHSATRATLLARLQSRPSREAATRRTSHRRATPRRTA
jgi:hypothetical protein